MSQFRTRDTLLVPQQGTGAAQTSILWQRPESTLRAGVPEAPILAEPVPIVEGDGFTISVELWIADIDNQLITDISAYLVDGAIDLNLDRAVKLAAQFAIRNPSMIAPYTDFLAPFFRKTFDDGRDDEYMQVGLFATKVAPGSYSPNDAVATFEGSDLTWIMATSYYTDAFNVAPGTNYVTGATGINGAITASGINRYNLPATTEVTPSAQSYAVGTSRLERANTMIDQLGWYHLGMDLDGKISTPGAPQNLASKEPWRTLTDSDLKSAVDVQPSGMEIANVVLVVNDDAAAAPLHATARNDDPQSPTSTVAIGRSIMRLEKVTGSTTQAALDSLASRLLAESRTYYRTAKITLLHDPTALIAHQTVCLTLTGEQEALSGLWWVRTATLGLTPDKPTVLELNQITSDLDVAVI